VRLLSRPKFGPGSGKEGADAQLIEIVRDKMLGTRPSDSNHSLIGKVIFAAGSRQRFAELVGST
jgi:hypothetical protein